MRISILALSGAIALASAVPAQQTMALDSGAPQEATPVLHGLPGQRPGTEVWMVQFKQRSFTLDAFRAANFARDAAKVEQIVTDLERRVVADQAPFVKAIEALGGRVIDQWWIVNACAIEIDPAKLGAVRKLANVMRVQPDEAVFPVIKTATNSANHNSDAVNAKGFKGKGIATAIMDTGLDGKMGSLTRPHRTFYEDGNLTKRNRLIINKALGRMPADNSHPHGTGVAGIAAGGNWGTSGADNGHAPHADIAGYAISNNSAGGSSLTVIARAWQAIAADAAANKIRTANNSYSGSPDPLNVSQQALDSAALNADIMVCVAAGNSSSSTRGSQSCANGLAVGAVNPNTHTMATFSSRGPLSGDTQRFYPDIAACGVRTVMPRNNNEGTNYIGSGTSMASPQVCGAATLLRSAVPALKAVETKAILLATALDISAKNPNPPYNSRNAYGMGLLKDDAALAVAQNATGHGLSKVTTTSKTFTRPLACVKGKSYRVAVAWMRSVMTSRAWSNLDIEVKLGGTVVASSKSTRNLYELAGWTAKVTGAYLLVVTATSIQGSSQDFAWAFTEGVAPPVVGTYTTFGAGCKGSGQAPAGGPVSPKAYATKWGESANYFPHGRANMRYQQIHNASDLRSFVITGLAYRLDERFGGPAGSMPYEVRIGYSSNSAASMSTVFASNYKGTPTTVFKGTFNFPAHSGGNTNLKAFAVQLKFTRPWPYVTPKGNLLWEAINSATTSRVHFFDWARANGLTARRIWAFSKTATTGSRDATPGALVTQFLTPGGSGAVPLLSNTGKPEVNKTFQVTLAQALGNAPAGLIFGSSNTKWGAINLPLSLNGLGANGCSLLVSFDILFGLVTDAGGNAKVTVGFPNDKSLISVGFHNQFLIIDKNANTLGIAWSNGGTGLIGGQP